MQSSFKEPRAQHAGNEVCAEAQSLKAGAQCRSRQAAIKTGDESDRWIGERRNHVLQIIFGHSNVTVVDQKKFMPRRRQHLCQIAEFNVGAEDTAANDEFDGNLGILDLKITHNCDSRIVRIADSEHQLKFGVLLFAVAAKALPYFGIDAL